MKSKRIPTKYIHVCATLASAGFSGEQLREWIDSQEEKRVREKVDKDPEVKDAFDRLLDD